MLIPHLHIYGNNCKEAIALYERAFNTTADAIVYSHEYDPTQAVSDNIAHAVMHIHGQKVFLNSRFGKKDVSTDIAIHLIVVFASTAELLSCYEVMKHESITVDPLETLPYSPLSVQFIDKFGVQWGFMVDKQTPS